MNKNTLPIVFFAFGLGLFSVSCNSDETENPAPPNFEIVSSGTLEILETYENGWIKEAVRYNEDKQPLLEFSYHQNGHLKNYRLYRSTFTDTRLYLEHERNDADQPLRSRYYDLEGNLYADLLYENGLLSAREVYYENTQTTFLYEQGVLQRAEKTDNETGRKILVTYDYPNGKRILQIEVPGMPGYTMEASLSGELGAGYNATDDLTLLNIMEHDSDASVTTVNTASSSSLTRKTAVDILELCVAPIDYYDLGNDFIGKFGSSANARKIKRVMNSDFNRSIEEQYPFVEEAVFVAGSSVVAKQYALKAGLSGVIAKTGELKAQHPEDFGLLYGDGYFGRYFTGKNLVIVGTIRNLPTDRSVRDRVIAAAETHANELLTGYQISTDAERELLSHVFFQLKAHSNVPGMEERIINSHEEYLEVTGAVNAAAPVVVHSVLSRNF